MLFLSVPNVKENSNTTTVNIHFKKATLGDIALIAQLADSIWRRHYPTIISLAQIDYMLALMYSPTAIAQQMQQGQHYTLIYNDSEAVGYYAVSEKEVRHYFLHKFYIDTTKHRQGMGAVALQYMLDNDCQGYESICLQVNRRNIKAVNFYFKQGFVIDHAMEFDIGQGYTMDDFVMKKRI